MLALVGLTFHGAHWLTIKTSGELAQRRNLATPL
jgi:cytochrome bd-type quinol oxidase subunit 2